MPDEPARLDILRIKTRHMRMSDDVDLQALAHDTQGYCGADLAQTVFESAMLCLREKLPGIDLEAETVPSELLLTLRVGPDHVRRALRLTNPSSLRETAIEVPNTKWVDIGGARASLATLHRRRRGALPSTPFAHLCRSGRREAGAARDRAVSSAVRR